MSAVQTFMSMHIKLISELGYSFIIPSTLTTVTGSLILQL